MRRTVESGIVVLVMVVASACSKKQPPVQAPPPAEPPPAAAPQPAPARDDSAERRAAEIRRMTAQLEEMVFFGYDRSDLTPAAQSTLNSKVPILRTETSVRLRIDGHADERGSLEYNLALGMRRAQAVRDFLAGFGIDASRLAVESLGEDRPLDPGHNEAAWSRNRRAEFGVTGFNR